MRKAIQQYLHRGFPLLSTDHQSWWYIACIGFYIALLMNLEQPFGLYAWEHPYKWLVLSGFGLIYAMVTVFYYLIFQVLFPRLLHAATWTVGKEILISLIIFVSAGIVNWGYALATISLATLSLTSYARIQSKTFVFGFLPVVLLASLMEVRYLRRIRQLADNANKSGDQLPVAEPAVHPIVLNGFQFEAHEFLFIQANQNYITIHYTRNGKNERKHCRITLKEVVALLEHHSAIVRCHKSFIVNTGKVIKSHGNSENFTLVLTGCAQKIPVSRNYFHQLKNHLPLK
jgi:hypothetical protein